MRTTSSFNHFVMLATAAVAMLMASCIRDEVVIVPDPIDDSRNIGFSANVLGDEAATRGGASRRTLSDGVIANADGDLSLPLVVTQEQGIRTSAPAADTRGAKVTKDDVYRMRVWATYHKDGATELGFNDENHDGSQGLDFVRQEGSTVFHSDPQYMWPGSGTFDFVSVGNLPGDIASSISETNPGSGAFYATLNAAGTAPEKFTYRVPDEAERQSDIIIAKTTGIQGDTNASVPLDFKHIMAAVNFKVGDVVQGRIESITLRGIYNKADYLLAENQWVGRSIENDGVFTATIGTAGNIGSDNAQDGNTINDGTATFMMIPQTLFTGAVLEVQFTHTDPTYAGNKSVTLLAPISAQDWAMNTTTNYRININREYQLQIVPEDLKLDSHYVMTLISIESEYSAWDLEAVADDGADVTIEFEDKVNAMAKAGFWTDKYVTKNSNGVYVVGTKSARGVPGNEGLAGTSGNFVVRLFVPENVSSTPRRITLNIFGHSGSDWSEKEIVLEQSPIYWHNEGNDESNSIGLEQYIENGVVDWGFCWDGITEQYITTQGNGTFVPSGQLKHVTERLTLAGFDMSFLYDPNSYIRLVDAKTNDDNKKAGDDGWLLLIDYSKIGNIEIASDVILGYQNTLELYNFEGLSTLQSMKDFIAAQDNITYTANSGEANVGNTLDFAAFYAMKRNRFHLYDDGQGLLIPHIEDKDINWYLPAKEQFATIMNLNANWGQKYTFNDYYWTSTSYVPGEGDAQNAHSYAYLNMVETVSRRTERYLTMAVRRYTATSDVEITPDNTVIPDGGDNGPEYGDGGGTGGNTGGDIEGNT